MKYTTTILIDKPLSEVITKLNSTENMKHWQDGLNTIEHISGTPGKFGARMKLKYDFGKRQMELIETITKENFPEEFHATYSMKGLRNIQQHYFETVSDSQTKWTSINEFQPTNFVMNLMLICMPKSFKKQTKKYMDNFKAFTEHNISIAQST